MLDIRPMPRLWVSLLQALSGLKAENPAIEDGVNDSFTPRRWGGETPPRPPAVPTFELAKINIAPAPARPE